MIAGLGFLGVILAGTAGGTAPAAAGYACGPWNNFCRPVCGPWNGWCSGYLVNPAWGYGWQGGHDRYRNWRKSYGHNKWDDWNDGDSRGNWNGNWKKGDGDRGNWDGNNGGNWDGHHGNGGNWDGDHGDNDGNWDGDGKGKNGNGRQARGNNQKDRD
jgi:hypothetical protein